MGDDIKIIPFESKYQAEVADLFVRGLTESYQHKSETIKACQKKFVALKLSPEGDMGDIVGSFMSTGDPRRHFWIAVDGSGRVVGHVGLVPSTYPADATSIYDESRGITPDTVGELIRMSVHRDMRGRGVGQRLCAELEVHAKSNGMKRIALSTLAEMDPAVALYSRCGYQPAMQTPIDTSEWLGPGEWEPLVVAHFTKDLTL